MNCASRLRPAALALTLAITAALLALAAPAARAAPTDAPTPSILISNDGISYGSTPDALFPAGIVMIPGSAYTGSLYVKNVTDAAAIMTIRLADVAISHPSFAEALTLTSTTEINDISDVAGHRTARPGPESTIDFADLAAPTMLLPRTALGADQHMKLVVTLSMADVGDSTAQRERAQFAFVISLSADTNDTDPGTDPVPPDVSVPAFPPGPDAASGPSAPAPSAPDQSAPHPPASDPTPSAPRGSLSSTGTDFLRPTLTIGAAMIGAGTAIVVGVRRRKGARS